jgi:Transposase DDE domain
MDASEVLLDQWSQQVKEIFPSLHAYQQKTIALCVQGIIESGNAVMQRVAETLWEHLGSETKMASYERRLQRFVDNDGIEVEACWGQFLQQVLPFWQNKPVTLILDMTPYNAEATIVYVGMLVQSRVLPMAWRVMPQQEKWEQGQWEILGILFEQIAAYLSRDQCTLLADRGLSCLALIELCKRFGWHYVLRIKNEEWCRRNYRHTYRDWEQGKSFVKKTGDHWYGEVLLWKEHEAKIWLSASWEPGYEQAWFLISDRPASPKRVSEYARRMKVEATFEDQKSRGYLIECSQFKKRDHLDRWLFVVHLAMWWIARLGCSCLHHSHREQVDRKDRRDKGLLRIGCLWLKAILKRANRALFCRESRSLVKAHLIHCLLFSHRKQRLFFSIYLH